MIWVIGFACPKINPVCLRLCQSEPPWKLGTFYLSKVQLWNFPDTSFILFFAERRGRGEIGIAIVSQKSHWSHFIFTSDLIDDNLGSPKNRCEFYSSPFCIDLPKIHIHVLMSLEHHIQGQIRTRSAWHQQNCCIRCPQHLQGIALFSPNSGFLNTRWSPFQL